MRKVVPNIFHSFLNFLLWIFSKKLQMFSSPDQMDALTNLVGECSLNHIRHLRSVIEPFFQKDFIKELPKEVSKTN